jgi:hypothetical protein
MSACPKGSGVRDQTVVLEGVRSVDYAYVMALLWFVVVLMLDLVATRPIRRAVEARTS